MDLNREFPKEEISVAKKYLKEYSSFLAIREMQTKTTLRFFSLQLEWLWPRKQPTTKAGEAVGEKYTLSLLVRLQTGAAILEISSKHSQEAKKCIYYVTQLYHSLIYAQKTQHPTVVGYLYTVWRYIAVIALK